MPTATFPEILNGLMFRLSINVHAKFEFRNFTRSWDNRGYQKIGQSLDTPTLTFL